MTESLQRFEELSEEYDDFRRAIPKYDEMNEIMLEIFSQWSGPESPGTICELGVGTGQFAQTLINRFQPEYFCGLDGATEMVRQSRENLEECSPEVELQVRTSRFEQWNPSHSYDWIYSSLSIHHLSDLEKRGLFDRIHGALSENGLFVLCDLVGVSPDREAMIRELYQKRLEKLDYSRDEIDERWEQHKQHDRPAALRAMLRWLRATGFGTVECVWKDLNRVILMCGRKDAPT